jgi:outer membrane lipoprotein-sorting protein
MSKMWLRWAPAVVAVAVVAGVAIAVPVSANATATLPVKTPAQVLELVAASRVDAFSGTVTETSDLGLPSLPSGISAAGGSGGSDSSLSSLLTLITGSNSLRVYVDGPKNVRLQVLGSLSEKDVIRHRSDLWYYDSSANSVTHATIPTAQRKSAPAPMDITPDVLATKLLAAVEPTSTVSVGEDVNIAGRSAYDLILTPKATDTLVGSITIAVDSATGLPLGVDVQAAGQISPAVSVAFTSLSLGAPDASLFDFTPPAGAKVTQETTHKPAKSSAPKSATKSKTTPTETVTGKGWDSVVSLSNVGSLSKLSSSPEFAELTTAVSGGRVLHTTLFNILFTTDGRVIAGAVSIAQLQAAASAA